METRRVRALYSYARQQSNELSFRAGDILEDVVEHEDGWWTGSLNGQNGLFPSTYVERLNESFGGGGGQGAAGVGQEVQVQALYDYVAKSENELMIRKGDIFIVNEKDGEGKWWHGVFTEPTVRKGWFPASYVSELPSQPSASNNFPNRSNQQQQQQQQYGGGVGGGGAPPQPVVAPAPAMKPQRKEKAAKGVIGLAGVDIFGANNLPADTKQCQVHVGIRDENDKVRIAFKTEVVKRDLNPFFMEPFEINVFNPEENDIAVIVLDGKKTLSDFYFPLRSTKRAPFEAAGGSDSTVQLKAGGTLRLVIRYRNVNEPSRPKNFTKDETISVSVETGGFDLSKASATWIAKFQEAGLEVAPAAPPPQHRPSPPPRGGVQHHGAPPPLPPRE